MKKTLVFIVVFIFCSFSYSFAAIHKHPIDLQLERITAEDFLLDDAYNLVELANETMDMKFNDASKAFYMFIGVNVDDDPEIFSKRVMRISMAYVALCGVCPGGKFMDGHILLRVLGQQLDMIEKMADDPQFKISQGTKKQIFKNLGRKLSERKYSNIIYEE